MGCSTSSNNMPIVSVVHHRHLVNRDIWSAMRRNIEIDKWIYIVIDENEKLESFKPNGISGVEAKIRNTTTGDERIVIAKSPGLWEAK